MFNVVGAGLLILASGWIAGCDDSGRSPGATHDGGSGGSEAGGAPCIGSIAEVEAAAGHPVSVPSACPPTYGDAMRNPVGCGASFAKITFGHCGQALVMSSNCLLHGFICVYDQTTQDLVGAAAVDDTLTYCNRTSSCIAGGVLPAEISCAADGLRLSCDLAATDGGLPDSVASDTGAPTCFADCFPPADCVDATHYRAPFYESCSVQCGGRPCSGRSCGGPGLEMTACPPGQICDSTLSADLPCRPATDGGGQL
jgi:hypothetical protein